MLKRLGEFSESSFADGREKLIVDPSVRMADANFPAPFVSGLEYGAPARGTWNIVHVGMLIPEVHQIFVCAQGCLRGVVLTAAEMGASERFSTVVIREHNVLDGDMEDLIIDGVSDILERLPKRPPAVLVYTSCIHHFMGSDLNYVYKVLHERFPDVRFTDCYMNPIMRKSGLTPDQTMRRQLYSLLKDDVITAADRNKRVHMAGGDFALDTDSELYTYLTDNGYEVCQVAKCKDYEEYQQLSQCDCVITTFPAAKVAGDYLESRFNQKHLYLPASFSYEKIDENMALLKDALGLQQPFEHKKAACEAALAKTKAMVGDTQIDIDFTAFPMMLSLTKLLVEHGFNVRRLYTDSFVAAEKEIFDWLQVNAPDIEVYPTVHAAMRVQPRKSENKVLAIGQKAAYFSGTDYFVNVVEGGGFWGYGAILKLADLMCEAFETPKDTRSLIQIKGMGCGNCV